MSTDHAVAAPKDPDCDADSVTALEQMFVDRTMRPRIAAGQQPVRRAVFLKPHGVAHGTFSIDAGLRPDLAASVAATIQRLLLLNQFGTRRRSHRHARLVNVETPGLCPH